MRIMGPNCLGIFNGHENLNGTYLVRPPLQSGNISVASQSGAYGGILVHELNARGIGLGKFASTGNQVDISHEDCIEHFADDDDTEVIGLFVEGIKDGPAFLSAIQRVSKRKPIVVFKAGRTSAGRRAAASHTGSLAGDFQVFQAAVRQAGAIVAHTTDEFHDSLCALSCWCHRLPRENSVAIVTISGGPSVAAGDYCEELGLVVPPLSDELRDALRPHLPHFAAVSNPVDMTVATPLQNFGPIVDAVVAEPTISGAIAINWGWDRPEFAQAFVDASEKHEKPVLACAVENPLVQGIFRKNRVPNLTSPERAVRSYWTLVQQRKIMEREEVVKNVNEKR
jgi:acyl-CoA synthetase (NDP forming)